jgi:RNA polymerase sigma-70 factor (ECF subfamily)
MTSMSENFQRRSQWLASAIMPHEPALRAWLLGKRFPGIDIDDIVQEAYSTLASLDSVEHIRNARTYLFQVARSIVLDQIRHGRVVSMESVADIAALGSIDPQPSPETQAGDRQELRTLGEAIATLSGRRREVFMLRKIAGMSQRDVARRLGISESAVENQVARAIEALGKLIGRGGKQRVRPSKDQSRHEPMELNTVDARPRNQRRDL